MLMNQLIKLLVVVLIALYMYIAIYIILGFK